jgi:hypothetical protein
MGSPTLRGIVESLSSLASKAASERIRSLIKKQVLESKRHGTWFRLSVQERSMLELVLKVKVSFKSGELMRAILSVMRRLQQVSSQSFVYLLRGSALARAFSDAAVSWGNEAARSWGTDEVYVDFLGRFHAPARLR